MSLLRKIPTILRAGGGSVPEWRQHLQPCEYLETDGNCYIYTGLGGKNYENFELKFSVANGNSGNSIVFGSRLNINNNYIIYPSIDYDEFRIWYNYEQKSFSIDLKNNKDFIIKAEKNIFKIYDFNNNLLQTISFSNNSFSFGTQLLLFGAQLPSVSPAQIGTRIYSNTIENLRNYIAAYIIDEYVDNKGTLCSSGVAGMVDTLTGIFYTNDGTGQFSHGADINI